MTSVPLCPVDAIDPEDVARFDHRGHTVAIYRPAWGEVFATDGLCTHEQVQLAGGPVTDDTIECPKHNGRFNCRTGAPLCAPACVSLAIYPARLHDGTIEVVL